MNTGTSPTAHETALQVAKLVRSRRRLETAGDDLSSLDQQLKPYKVMYVHAGAIYGGNSEGMVKWFDERAVESKPASDFAYEVNHDGLRRL